MRDPVEELESFTNPTLSGDQLPASEVRRRGTRLQRRNRALGAIAGIAAVAIVVTPFAVASAHHGSSAPDPVKPPHTWTQSIPEDFPLTEGLPEQNGHDGSPVRARDGYQRQAVEVCAGEGWSPGRAKGVNQAIYTGESEGGQDRTIAVYGNEYAASAALSDLKTRVRACAEDTAPTDGRWATVLPADDDSTTLAYADHMSDAGDMFVNRVVRVGNALLVESTYALGGGDPTVIAQTADLLRTKSSSVVDAMCRFSAEGC